MHRLSVPGLLLLVGLSLDPVTPSFTPTDGLVLEVRSVRVFELELESTELEVELDGDSVGDQEPPGVGFAMVETETIRFVDRFEVEEGSLRALEREFQEIGTDYVESFTDPEGESFERKSPGTSVLEGATVRFAWGEDGEESSRSFVGDDDLPDEDLLAGLDPSAHLAGFLPGGPVEIGEGWGVELSAFVEMMNLSGSLAVLQEGEEESADDSDYGRQFDENLEGEIRAELAEVREQDGRRVAVVSIVAELSTEIETLEEVEAGEATGRIEERHRFEFELEGELSWDLAGGHALSLSLEGGLELELETEQRQSVPGHELRMLERQLMDGLLRFDIEVERGG
jgi:hypothetical protein